MLTAMNYQDVLDHFGTVQKICDVTGLTHQAVYYWKSAGKVSMVWQYKFQEMTEGKIKVNGSAARSTASDLPSDTKRLRSGRVRARNRASAS